jgi:thioredoxin reductase (NADPH)
LTWIASKVWKRLEAVFSQSGSDKGFFVQLIDLWLGPDCFLRKRGDMEIWDVIIIGGGPAGLTAGLYAARAGLKTLALEKECWGGKVTNIDLVENYPGFEEGISGAELAQKMMAQAMKYGVEFELTEVTDVELREEYKVVRTYQGDYWGKTIIIGSGTYPKKLGVPGEEEFVGRGVAYCAVCDGGSYANGVVAVAGGGDSGITEGLYLTRLCSKVIVIEQLPEITATSVLRNRALSNPKMEIRSGMKIEAIEGDTRVKRLKLVDINTGQGNSLEIDGVFVYVGLETSTEYLKEILPLGKEEQILVNDRLETPVAGLFAAGDIRDNSKRQIITAAGDGATAALSAQRYLLGLRE